MDDFTVEGRLYSAAECAQVRPGSGHVGLALSGGGSRTAAACIGALRTLRDLGLLAEVRAISAVSGATWCTVPFTFLPAAFDEDAFLGQRAGDPAKLQLGGEGPASLGHLPAGALGQRFTELGMSTLALLGGSLADGARGVPGHRLWSRQIAEQILVPFELAAFDEAHRPIDWFAPDAATEAAIRAHSPGLPARCYTVRASERAPRPELRVQIALRAQDDQGRTTLVPTFLSPTVAGIPGTACGTLDGRPVGGGGVSSYAFGGYRVGPTTLRIEAPLALSDLTGIASSAYAADQTEGITPLLGYFGPEWPMPAGAAGRFVDAGLLENSGVASLLACEEIEAIIAVVNPPQGMDRAGDDVVVEAQIARLFGYRPYDKRTGWQRAQPDDEGDGRHCQVFASDEGQFQQLLAALGDRRAAGDATAYSQALTTVDNARFAVRGGRQVRVLWVVQTAAARWMDALTPPVRLALGPKFPNIPTAFTALPAPQVNGLSHFADWLLDQSRAALEALFERR